MALEPPPVDVLDTDRAGDIIIRGGALRAAAYIGGALLAAASASLLTRHLGPAEFGRYVTVFSLVTVVGAVTEAGMSALGVREYAQRTGDDRDALMRSLLGLRLVLTLVGIVVALGFALAAGYRGALLLGTVLAGVGLVVTVFQTALMVGMQARLQLVQVAGLEFLRQFATTVAIVGLVLAGAGVAAVLGAAIPVGLLLLALTVPLIRHAMPLRPSWTPRTWARLLKVTISFALASAVGTLYVYTTQVITSLVADAQQAGYFGVSFRVFLVAAAFPGLIIGSALPLLARAARDDRERLAYVTQRLFDVSMLLGPLFAIATTVGAPVAVDLVGGSDYGPATGALRIQGAAIAFSFFTATWSYALVSLHRHRALLVANGAAFLTSMALALALAPAHGARGAAIATLVAEAVLPATLLVGLVRARPDLRPDLQVVWRVTPAIVVAVAAAVLCGLPALPATVIAVAIYGAGVVAARAVPDEVVELVRGRR